MKFLLVLLIPAMWTVWMLYWFAAARGVKTVARRESLASRAAHMVPLFIAVALLSSPNVPGWLGSRWAMQTFTRLGFGTVTVAAGLMLCVWARRVLGGNWSGTVTIKHNHEIVRAGPYRWVRHPIYSGLLVAFIGSAIARPRWAGVVAFVLVFIALWRKLRVEERWLEASFGAAYADYRRTSWALIPYVL
jgi:protein-S-isoprenylcysteine O-methyltransferase Ste14